MVNEAPLDKPGMGDTGTPLDDAPVTAAAESVDALNAAIDEAEASGELAEDDTEGVAPTA